MKPKSLLLTIILLVPLTLKADNPKGYSDEEQQVMQRYYELFNKPDKQKEFYELNEQAKDIMVKRSGRKGYYTFRVNEVTYEINMHRNGKALKMAEKVLDEMKEQGDNYFDMIYSIMGTIYEDRGNYKMAHYFNQKAIDAVSPNDTTGIIGAYLGMANLESSVHPDEAIRLIDHILPFCNKYPIHYNYALTMKALAYYFKNDAKSFFQTQEEYNTLKRENNLQDEQNDGIMKTIQDVFQSNYASALNTINNKSLFTENMGYFDMLIQLYQLKGDKDKVIHEQQRKIAAIDSLNANLIYENMNEMNAEMEVNKAHREIIKNRLYWLSAVVVLLLVVLGLLVWRHLTRRHYQKTLIKQNKELEIALSRAEESDRMKDSFIEHVSHEIRTPLNVITGYAQIITNPNFDLKDEERNRMLNDISKNTQAITEIVNELLDVAQYESKEHYQKEDNIDVGQLCQALLHKAEQHNKHQLRLTFNNELSEGFVLRCNRNALEKILNQLLNNALKFTTQGGINLRVHESPDHGVVRFIITDTGIGIAKEHQKLIFNRFYKEDTFKQGFGLGLTIARKMALLLDGSLHLDANYTNGSRFILTIPVVS